MTDITNTSNNTGSNSQLDVTFFGVKILKTFLTPAPLLIKKTGEADWEHAL